MLQKWCALSSRRCIAHGKALTPGDAAVLARLMRYLLATVLGPRSSRVRMPMGQRLLDVGLACGYSALLRKYPVCVQRSWIFSLELCGRVFSEQMKLKRYGFCVCDSVKDDFLCSSHSL